MNDVVIEGGRLYFCATAVDVEIYRTVYQEIQYARVFYYQHTPLNLLLHQDVIDMGLALDEATGEDRFLQLWFRSLA